MDLFLAQRHFRPMILHAFLLAAQAEPLPHTGPSFDCTAATTPVEQAVCDDPALSRLDHAMAAEYARARRNLSPNARAALIKDQRWFLGTQQEWYANRERWADFPDLASRFRSRTSFLASIRADRTGWAGRWGNLAGEVTISPSADGTLSLKISTAQPTNARWLCDVEVRGRFDRGRFTIAPPGDLARRLHIELRDGLLTVRDDSPARNLDACGMNGSVAGEYFAIGDPASSAR